MKPISKKQIAVRVLLASVCISLFSFSLPKGGDSFEIYLNKKLVTQQYVAQMKGAQTISLPAASAGDQFTVYYRHCGRIGTARHIQVKDAQNRVVKEWRFTDASGAAMTFPAKDILALQKNSQGKLNLYYGAHELQKEKLLAVIAAGTNYARL